MTMQRFATELEETARQTSEMVEAIVEALGVLNGEAMTCSMARRAATERIVRALQAQDRIEQRLRNMGEAARRLATHVAVSDTRACEDVWASLTLDELRLRELSGVAGRVDHGEVELF